MNIVESALIVMSWIVLFTGKGKVTLSLNRRDEWKLRRVKDAIDTLVSLAPCPALSFEGVAICDTCPIKGYCYVWIGLNK